MRGIVGLVALLSLVALADCGGGGGGAGNASCRSKLKKYISCGVFAGGTTTCHLEPEREYDACFAACVDEATCPQIENFVCDDDTTLCMDRCANDDFVCANGNRIDPLEECDGREDCGDHSDEDGCEIPIFRCDFQDEEIPGGRVCDGFCDCQLSTECEDEADCGEFLCGGD